MGFSNLSNYRLRNFPTKRDQSWSVPHFIAVPGRPPSRAIRGEVFRSTRLGGTSQPQALYLAVADGNRNSEKSRRRVGAPRSSEVGGCVCLKKKKGWKPHQAKSAEKTNEVCLSPAWSPSPRPAPGDRDPAPRPPGRRGSGARARARPSPPAAAPGAGARDPSAMSSGNDTSQLPPNEADPGMAFSVTDIAIIAGVIAAVAFVLVCLLLVMLHYMYRHKGTYHTNEAKGTEFAESADAALQDDAGLQDASDSSRKEYFI
nr:glycophorin-C [Oryctolagus cuniculus]